MIVEIVAGCLTVCFVSTLRFARWASEHNAQERRQSDPIAMRLAAVRLCRLPLEALLMRISRDGTDSTHTIQIKDQRLRELVQEIDRLSKLEAKILRGDDDE